MKRFSTRIWFVGLVVLGWPLVGCKEGQGGPQGPRGGNVEINAATLVETAPVEVGPFSVEGDYAGEVTAQRTAEVAFEVSGRITELDLDIGDRVEQDQTLARIESLAYRQQLREAKAAVQSARASLGEAEVAAENLENDLKRKRPLLEKSLITGREVEDLEAQLRQARQKVAVARAEVEQREARLQTAQEDLRNTEVRAPFDARIAQRHVDLGTYVGPSEPVFRLVSDSEVYLRINVPERDAPNVAVGKPVEVRMGSMGGVSMPARVARVSPSADPATRMLRVDVELDLERADSDPNNERDLDPEEIARRVRPGMYAQVQIVLGQRDEAITIPKQALLEERGGTPYVWVADDGKAHQQTILTGLRGRDRVEVVDGLEGNEQIIMRGFEKLEEGDSVQSLADREGPRPEPTGDEGGER